MAVINAKTLREKTNQELQDQMMLEKKRLFDGVVKGASGEAIKAHEKRAGKRLIARIQSILRERSLRTILDAKVAALTPKAEGAKPEFAKLVKLVDTRAAEIKAQLEKPVGSRKVKPMLKRAKIRIRGEATAPDRNAIRLAEAKRRRACLDRQDVGQSR